MVMVHDVRAEKDLTILPLSVYIKDIDSERGRGVASCHGSPSKF